MSKDNINNIIASTNKHVANINRVLKNIKSNVMVDFIHPESSGTTIISNLVASQSDLWVIERYVKNIENIRSDDIQVPRLPHLKPYLKILGILYFVEGTNTSITSDSIKVIIKANYIFNNLSLTAKSRIVKTSPRSNMTVIWIDVWNTKSCYSNH